MWKQKKNKLVYGWGINDVDYNVHKTEVVNGKYKKIWKCPYYADWAGMVERCHSPRYHRNNPSYYGCTICEGWKYLSDFIRWVDSQPNKDWMNCSPDKDFLVKGNKHYSPDTVVYIPQKLNSFIIGANGKRGECMIGVTLSNSIKNPYQSYCRNPFNCELMRLGYFATELEAHKAWQAKKHEYACMLAVSQEDSRVADALRQRYSPEKDWTNY